MSPPRTSIAAETRVCLAFWLAMAVLLALLPSSSVAQDLPPPPSTQFGTLVVRQNDNLNTPTSITMSRGPGSTLRWEPVTFASNRGDYGISFLNENDFTSGTLIATVSENGRDNSSVGDAFGTFYSTVSVATATGTDPPTAYFFAMARAAQGSEVNANISFGYFPYDKWLGGTGWIGDRGNGLPLNRFNGSAGLGLSANLVDIGSGVTQLDLRTVDPTATPANGIVLVNHAKNEDNYASSVVQNDEITGEPVNWRLHIRDNGANSPSLSRPDTEQDPVTFVYLPVNKVGTDGLLALGRVNNDATTDVAGGGFEIEKGNVDGRWYLKITGGSPATGTLLVSPEGGTVNNMDNIVSYQWDATNSRYVIESRDIINDATLPVLQGGADAEEDMFSFAFFAAPVLPEVFVTSPTEGQVYTSPATFAVTANASDFNGNVAQVEFFRNGTYIGVDTEAPYSVQETDLAGGRYIYTARATDNDGLAPRSSPVTAVVQMDPLNPPQQTALFFDGLVEHVATNPAPQFGVGGPPTKGLTLEAWFRKEGLGATASSGVGGIVVQPLFAKGRGESDNNNTDTNYLVGITQDGLLCADFEAFPTPGVVAGGANFPIFGTHEPIQDGRWYHAAVTYDGEAGGWKLFLDGVQVATRSTPPGTMPRYDSNHRFAIGAALNTAGQRAGSFFGAIDEVRVWNYARSAADIASTKDSSVVTAAGLVGRFGLDEATGVNVTSSVDGLVGQVKGPVDGGGLPVAGWQPLWVAGAPLTNQAPSLVLNSPKSNQVFRSETPILISATAGDLDGNVVKVEFFDGETKLAELAGAPYQFLWSGAPAGTRVIRAMATDDDGAVAAQMVNITVITPSDLLLTELHSNPSGTAPVGVGDYWELTNFGSNTISLAGYTWNDSGRNRNAALAWAFPEGTGIAPGESVVFTPADPGLFRTWWGLPPTTRVLQSVGAPGLGLNDGVVLYDSAGAEVFYFSYAAGGFTRSNGQPSLGGHAGASAGGLATEALVWDPNSGRGLPRYMAASSGVNGGVQASTGTDVGSPGGTGGTGVDPATLLLLKVAPAAFSEGAGAAAAVGTVERYGDVAADLTVQLVSGDASEATVPASVVIPAGQSAATFDVSAVNDVLADGTQQVLLTATAPGVSLAAATLSVQDDSDVAPPTLFVTEIHSSPSDALGAADYWELTNHGTVAVNLSGFTWDDESRSFAEGQPWAFPNGTSIAAGESIIITTADPAAFRTWWGLEPTVQVLQTVDAPGLGQNDGIALFDNTGRELFFVSYAAQGFLRPDGSAALGGHAGVSGGGATTDALVWDVPSGVISPRYVAAQVGTYQAFQAPGATDIGSPGRGAATVPVSFTLQLLHFSDAQGGLLAPQTAPNLAALVDAFDQDYTNTLIVSGGDSFLPGSFLSAGADPALNAVASVAATAPGRPDLAIHNLIGVEAAILGHHEWDLGSAVLANALQPAGAWVGAQFPLLSLNLDFSADSQLSGLVSAIPLDTDDSLVPEAAAVKGRLVPVTVVSKGGEKIGLVGVSTQLLASLTSLEGTVVKGGNTVNLDVLAAQIQPSINELGSEGVSKIVLLSHLNDLALERALAVKLADVDIIVAAGSETRLGDSDDTAVAFPGHEATFEDTYPLLAEDRNGTPLLIVNTDSEYSYLGRLVVDFDLEGRLITSSLPDRLPENGAYTATATNVAAAWGVAEANLATTAFAAGTKGAQVKQVTDAVQAVMTAKDSIVYGYSAVYLEGAAPSVRSQETNLGNLVADANQQAVREIVGGSEAIVSLKHAGGISGPMGSINGQGGVAEKGPTLANAAAGKAAGAISKLDIENALRGNQKLMVFETTPAGLKAILEHGVSQGINQAQFPQLGGVQFAWDPDLTVGSRVLSIALLKDDGSAGTPVYKAGNLGSGMLPGAPAVIRVVTMNGLANGEAGYPMKANGENFRYVLGDGTLGAVVSEALDYTAVAQVPGNGLSEQESLAGHVQTRHGNLAQAYRAEETGALQDTRVQNVNVRADTVPPVTGADSDGDGLTDIEEIMLGGNPTTRLRVGERVNLNLGLYAQAGQTLKIVGRLPPGLTFNATTKQLTGVLGGTAAFYDLQLQVLVGGKIVKTIIVPLVVEAFPARLLGSYEALLETATDVPQGIVRVTVTQSGLWSATLDLRGTARRSSKGSFELMSGSRQVSLPMVFKSSRTTPEVTVQMILDIDSPQVTGTHTGTASNGAVRGMRMATFGASPPTTRRMNVVLDAGTQDGVAYPAGLGWAKGTVTNKGAVNLAGELGDGQKMTLSLRLGVTGQSLAWVQPYKNKVDSYFGGVLPVPNVGQPAAMTPALESGAVWFKAADAKELSYDTGFAAPLPVSAIATAFDPVKTAVELESLFGLTASTLNVEIEGAGLSSTTGVPIVLPTAFKLATTFSLTTFAPVNGPPVPWTGKINKADGGLTGTLTLPASANTLPGKAAATGILLRGLTDGTIGGGIVRVSVPGKKGQFRTASLLLQR